MRDGQQMELSSLHSKSTSIAAEPLPKCASAISVPWQIALATLSLPDTTADPFIGYLDQCEATSDFRDVLRNKMFRGLK